MRVVFVRHGEPRRGESDPALTSEGRRQARETALWLAERGWAPSRIVSTRTRRTRQTAEELALVFTEAEPVLDGGAPELAEDWSAMVDDYAVAGGITAFVGHHPTVALLLSSFGPSPVRVPVHNLAVALCLVRDEAGRWSIPEAWPGR